VNGSQSVKQSQQKKQYQNSYPLWLFETMNHSTAEKRNNYNEWPEFTATFIYQEQLTIEKHNKSISSGTDNSLGYPTVINCAE
jgi:hypothetical protein